MYSWLYACCLMMYLVLTLKIPIGFFEISLTFALRNYDFIPHIDGLFPILKPFVKRRRGTSLSPDNGHVLAEVILDGAVVVAMAGRAGICR